MDSMPVMSTDTAEYQTPVTISVNFSLTTVASLFVLARVYSCLYLLRRRLYLEEWLIIISILLIWISVAFATTGFYSDLGRRLSTLSVEQFRKSSFWYTLATAPGIFGVGVPKMSVIILLCRIFRPRRGHVVSMWTASIICLMNFSVVALMGTVGCHPVQASWDTTIPNAKCINQMNYVYFCYYAGAFSAFLDLYFSAYPAVRFHRVTCSLKRKCALSFMLGLGLLYVTKFLWDL